VGLTGDYTGFPANPRTESAESISILAIMDVVVVVDRSLGHGQRNREGREDVRGGGHHDVGAE